MMKKLWFVILVMAFVFGAGRSAMVAELRPGEEEFNKALHMFTRERKQVEAFAEFQKSADKGFPDGFSWVGLYFLHEDWPGEYNAEKAVEFLKKGADLGSSAGLVNIGAIYTFGINGTQAYINIPLGIEYLEKAIAVDNPLIGAFINMGRVYEEGIGREKNPQKAREMYDKAEIIGRPPRSDDLP